MKIQYSETSTEDTSISISELDNSITLIGTITGDTYLKIVFPFKLSKIPPTLKDISIIQEKVYAFRNSYFSEYDICYVRGIEKKQVGYLFKPTIIFDEDAKYLFKDNKILQMAIFRSFVIFLKGQISLMPNLVKTQREVDYIFDDFFPSDIIFGVFPYEWNPDNSLKFQSQLFFNLYLKGFYLLNQKGDEIFKPTYISFQEDNYDSMGFHKTKFYKHLDLIQICDNVTSNTFCSLYTTNIIKENSNQVAKFHQVYALVEIFKDEILKKEINEKICEQRMSSNMTGNQIQKEVLEISRDSYNIGKLFTKYRNAPIDILDILFLEVSYFLDECRDKHELQDLKTFSQVYYYLRNIIVHDIQFLFIGDAAKILKLRKEFDKIIYRLEYLVLETLCHLNL